MERGIDVMTEKPMVIDEAQCQRGARCREDRAAASSSSRFNYRYAPKHQKIKELLMAGEIGKVTSVDFTWYPRHARTAPTTSGAGTGCGRRAARSGCTRRRTTSISSTGGSTPTRSRCRRSAACANYGKSGPVPAHELPRLPAQGEVRLLLGHHEEPEPRRAVRRIASRPTAISATAACSRKTSTSSTR